MVEKIQSFSDIWSIKEEVLEKNKKNKKDTYGIPDETKIAENVKGYVINKFGNIVAQFGFFVDAEGDNKLELPISVDGFLGGIYNKPTNIILGYGHPLGVQCMVDPKQSNILYLGPDATNGDQVIISIENDEKLKDQGMVCIIRDVDVLVDILPNDVKETFIESQILANTESTDLNELEKSYNEFIKQIYNILSVEKEIKNNEDITEKEITNE